MNSRHREERRDCTEGGEEIYNWQGGTQETPEGQGEKGRIGRRRGVPTRHLSGAK